MTPATTSKRSRPLPATERGRHTRAAIVDAAADLFYAQGVAATSLDEVLERSGAGKSQLYHYFADRRDLVRAVVDLQLQRVLGAQPRLAGIQSRADFEAWARDLVALHRGPDGPLACPVGSLASEIDHDPALRSSAAEALRTWATLIEQAVIRLQANGDVGADRDAGQLAIGILAALQGGMLVARSLGDADVLAEAVDQLLQRLARPPEGR